MSAEQKEGEDHENQVPVCMACGEEQDEEDSAFAALPCGHTWCQDCLKYVFMTAWGNGSGHAPECCPEYPEIEPTTEILELVTPLAAKPFVVAGKMATCPECEEFTCSPCGKPWHEGKCVEDPGTTGMKKLAKEKGWKQCPNCKTAIERIEGCPHMHCRCGCEFCFICGSTGSTEDCDCSYLEGHYLEGQYEQGL
ncbi:hypothetical protein PG984_013228 [Apiospora sp. TS-2023a]